MLKSITSTFYPPQYCRNKAAQVMFPVVLSIARVYAGDNPGIRVPHHQIIGESRRPELLADTALDPSADVVRLQIIICTLRLPSSMARKEYEVPLTIRLTLYGSLRFRFAAGRVSERIPQMSPMEALSERRHPECTLYSIYTAPRRKVWCLILLTGNILMRKIVYSNFPIRPT